MRFKIGGDLLLRARIDTESGHEYGDQVKIPLGRHLAMTVKTGNFCSYTPDPRSPISSSR